MDNLKQYLLDNCFGLLTFDGYWYGFPKNESVKYLVDDPLRSKEEIEYLKTLDENRRRNLEWHLRNYD